MSILAQVGRLVRNLPELVQGLWSDSTSCILVRNSDANLSSLRSVTPERNNRSILVVHDIIGPVFVCLDVRIGGFFGRVGD